MNNNRNNRRRGRGNNRSQGGGNQLNRIDSRARGNAPQLLEKYKKLAHDASMNGDRVQAEYYLQFADHYFRVIADTRTRQDEQRARRDEGRDRPVSSDEDRDDDEFGGGDYRSRQSPEDDDGDDDGAGGGTDFEPEQNPFTRSNRERAPRRTTRRPRVERPESAAEAPERMDPSVLPPSISSEKSDEAAEEKPRRRTRAKKPAEDEGGEELAKVS